MLTTEQIAVTDIGQKDFLSVHIFYNASDLRPVLMECVDPLVARFEKERMISRFFFVRYWEGGCHVRLRLCPEEGVSFEDLKQEIEPAVQAFLEDNPSLFDPNWEMLRATMRTLFEYEYGREEFVRLFGAEGDIEIADNNSYHYIPYKPEYGRYGGPDGIKLSEQHFHISSKIALKALRESNSHVKTSILGLALQLMFHFITVFYESKADVIDFFERYASRWHEFAVSEKFTARLDQLYKAQEGTLLGFFTQADSIHQNLDSSESGALGKWLRHAYWLRDNIRKLWEEKKLKLEPEAASYESAVRRLLISYVHMMNNRLGVGILEEVYMAHLIVRAVRSNL